MTGLGDAVAMEVLGRCYNGGIGVEADNALAFKWVKKSAENKNPSGMLQLAQCYENGDGVTKNSEEARKWYERAAAAGEETAKHWLAVHSQT